MRIETVPRAYRDLGVWGGGTLYPLPVVPFLSLGTGRELEGFEAAMAAWSIFGATPWRSQTSSKRLDELTAVALQVRGKRLWLPRPALLGRHASP